MNKIKFINKRASTIDRMCDTHTIRYELRPICV